MTGLQEQPGPIIERPESSRSASSHGNLGAGTVRRLLPWRTRRALGSGSDRGAERRL